MSLLSKHIRMVRINKTSPYVKGSVLDLGCGDAIVLKIFGDKIERYCGVEYDQKRVERLKAENPEHEFICRDLEEDPLGLDISFDTIFLTAVIEHIFNQKHLMQEILKSLKPDGKIIITTPTLFGDMVHRIGSKVGLFASSADDHHIIIYSRKRFEVLAKAFGLKILSYQTFEFRCNQLVVFGRNDQ
ncbi:MAG: class I SAM-dependent methyltransferase [Sedimentisphaerales bacterium]|nr:class I SAM-dependent methyltransferase [Sedimentisphaerales bacterium]